MLTSVSPITSSDTPHARAIFAAASTKRSLPFTNMAVPTMKIRILSGRSTAIFPVCIQNMFFLLTLNIKLR